MAADPPAFAALQAGFHLHRAFGPSMVPRSKAGRDRGQSANRPDFPGREPSEPMMPRPATTLIAQQIAAERQTQQSHFASLSSEQRLAELESFRVMKERGEGVFHPLFWAITRH